MTIEERENFVRLFCEACDCLEIVATECEGDSVETAERYGIDYLSAKVILNNYYNVTNPHAPEVEFIRGMMIGVVIERRRVLNEIG